MLQPLAAIVPDSGSILNKPSYTTVVKFDDEQELFWTGNFCGHVSSYYSNSLDKYTSFQVSNESDEVRSLIANQHGVLSLTQNSLTLNNKGGMHVAEFSNETMNEMQSMKILPTDLLLIGGNRNCLVEFDIERGKVIRTTRINEEGCVIIRNHPQYVCCGSMDGKITLRDAKDLKVKHTLTTHSVTLSDFDVQGNYLVTCGYSNKQSMVSDRFLIVHDLRMMKPISPIIMVFSPYLLRFIPAFSSRFCVVSQTGQLQFLDVTKKFEQPLIGSINLTPGSFITSMDISSSCQAFAFSDNAGYAYLYGSNNDVKFNNFSKDTEFVDPIEPLPFLSFDDQQSFSCIPFNKSEIQKDEVLLSDWPEENCKHLFRLKKPIDEDILKSMKMKGNIGYAQRPSKQKQNKLPCYTDEELEDISKRFDNIKNLEDELELLPDDDYY